jgi:hypothetical protein
MFAIKGGISTTQSPSELILNQKLDFNVHCKVEYGEYVQTHEEHDNSMATRTIGAIATRPTGNSQGGYYFIRLDTGRRINRRDWTALPMPQEVVDQVHRLARRAKSKKTLTFTNAQNVDLDVLYADLLDDDDDLPDAAGLDAGVNDHDNDDHGDDAGNNNDDEDNDDDSDYNPDGEDSSSGDTSDDESSSGDSSSSNDSNDNDADEDNYIAAPDKTVDLAQENAEVDQNTGHNESPEVHNPHDTPRVHEEKRM